MCFSVPNKIVLTFWARSERHPVGLALDKTWKLAVSTAEHFTKGNLICISWNLNLDFPKFQQDFAALIISIVFPHCSMQGYQDLNFCDLISASMCVVRHVRHIIWILGHFGQQLKEKIPRIDSSRLGIWIPFPLQFQEICVYISLKLWFRWIFQGGLEAMGLEEIQWPEILKSLGRIANSKNVQL